MDCIELQILSLDAKDTQSYNEVPIVYCAECLSLKIKGVDGIDYCEECGNTNINETNIFDWEKLYESKYGNKYIEIRNKNGEEKRK